MITESDVVCRKGEALVFAGTAMTVVQTRHGEFEKVILDVKNWDYNDPPFIM